MLLRYRKCQERSERSRRPEQPYPKEPELCDGSCRTLPPFSRLLHRVTMENPLEIISWVAHALENGVER